MRCRQPASGLGCGRWRFLICSLMLLGLVGCGYKDAPVPPQHALPAAVTDLSVSLNAQGAVLSWTYPRSTATGDDLEEIDDFILYRAEIPEGSYCETCPAPYSATMTIPGGTVPQDRAKTQVFEATRLRPGNLYVFKVRSKNGWWYTSQDSNEVVFYWQTPPAVPQGLNVVAGDGENTLRWQPVELLLDGTVSPVPVRYQLHRRVGEADFAPLGAPLTDTTYQDTAVENGRVYAYTIQAVTTYPRGTINGDISDPVLAQPLDTTSPPAPTGVEGIRTELGIKIYWNPIQTDQTDDLAGYRVYRHVQGKPVLVGEVLLPANLFTDTKAPEGPVSYSVTSFDTRTPANESPHSATVSITP
ncbi:MAG: hypothetical protein ACOX5Z_04910 [Desulfobulbus sp.]|jgi:hypothetical protein